MNQNYLIPANSKKSMLIFGLFNQTDLIILGIGMTITLIAIMIVPLNNVVAAILAILPGVVSAFLVFPIPNYHNVRTFIRSMYLFFTRERNFIWKGWCVEDGDKEE